MSNYPIIYRYRSASPRSRYASPSRGYSIFDHMQREMADMFNRAQSLIDTDGQDGEDDAAFFTPAIDHHESESEYRLSLELPGVKRDDVSIDVADGQITISGEKQSRYQTQDETGSRTETRYGRFHRSLPLPEGVDAEAVEATFEDGVLELTLPKVEQKAPQSRKIEIGSKHKALPDANTESHAKDHAHGETEDAAPGKSTAGKSKSEGVKKTSETSSDSSGKKAA